MSALGSLIVKLGLDYAQYTQGLTRSEQDALAHSKRIQDTMDGIKSGVANAAAGLAGVLAATLSVNAFKNLLNGAVQSSAELGRLALQAGATVEALSGIAEVGKLSGTEADQISESMNELTNRLLDVKDGSSGVGKAISVLGLDLSTFKALRPEDQMLSLATALDQVEDGAGKSAAVMALYGDEGQKLLPLFKDLADVGDLQAKVTTEQAEAAANYDKNIKRVEASSSAWANELVMGMIPALDDTAQAYIDVMNGTGGVREKVRALSADGSIKDWTTAAITGLSYVMDAGEGVVRVFSSLGKGLGALFAMRDAVASGNWSGVKNVWSDFTADLDRSWSDETLGQKFRARIADIQRLGAVADGVAPKLRRTLSPTGLGADEKGPSKEAETAYDRINKSISERLNLAGQQLTVGRQLTEFEKFELKVLADIDSTKSKLSAAERSDLQIKLQQLQVQDALISQAEKEAKALEEFSKAATEAHAADLKRAQAQEQTATALADGNRSLRDEIDLIGLSEAAQTRVLQLRNDAIILTKEAELAELQRQSAITGTMTRTEIALEAEIAALKERNALLGYKYDRTALAKAMDAELQDTLRRADQVGQGLANSLMQGGKSAWEYIKGLFRTELVMRVSGVFSAGAAGLFGGQTAMAASTGVSALSTASNAASIYTAGSTLGSVLTTAGQGLSSFTTALTAGVQNLVGLSGTTAQMTASLQAAGYWTGSAASTAATTAGASAGSTLVAAAPYAAAALVVLNALGAFRKTKTVGSGLMGELGGEINSYDLRRKSGTLFSGPDYSIRDNGLASQNQALQDAFKAMRTGAIQVAEAFDISAEGVENFTTRIGNELINPDTGGYGLKLEGLNEQQIQEKVQAALATANDAIAAEILGIKTVTVDTIKRTVTEVGSTWDDGYTTITREVEEQVTSTGLAVRRDLLPWMQRIADASGPTAATLQAIAAYPDQLLQLAGTSRDALVQAFGQGLMTGDAQAAGQTVANQLVASIEMSMMGNASAQIFDIINRGIVTPMIDALLTGQSVSAALSQSSLDAVVAKATATAKALGAVLNDPTFAAAMDAIRANVGSALSTAGAALSYTPQYQIQPATIATTTASAGSLGDAVDNLREKFDSAKTSLADTGHSLAIDLVRATGDEMAAQRMEREQYLAGFADLTAEEQRHLAVLYDQNQAIRDQITAIEKANQVAEQKAGLERQWLDLAGDTAAIRALELATIDPANRALQESLWARQDELAAVEKLNAAYASLTSTADGVADKYLSGSALTDYRYSRFAERANGIAGGGMVTGDVLQALGIADIQSAVLDFVRGSAAPEAKQAVLELGAALIDFKTTALDTARATADAAADSAFAGVERAIAAQRKLAETSRAAAQSLAQEVQGLFDTLQGAVDSLFGSVDSTQQWQAQQGQQYIAAALSAARATGALPDGKELSRAISAATAGLDAAQYATQAEADYARLVLANELRDLQSISGDQLSEAERMLGVAEAQLSALDSTMQTAREQLDQLKGINTAVQSVPDALAAFGSSLSAALALRSAATAVPTGAASAAGATGVNASSGGAVYYGANGAQFDAASGMGYQAGTGMPWLIDSVRAEAQALLASGQEAAVIAAIRSEGYTHDQAERMFGMDLPRFSGGGYHTGGLAIVGEEGPELVDLGPSRIYTAPQTSALLGLGQGSGNAELLAEVRALRQQNERLEARLVAMEFNTRRSADGLERVTRNSALVIESAPTF